MPRNGNVESVRYGLTSDERRVRRVGGRDRVVIDDDDLDAAAARERDRIEVAGAAVARDDQLGSHARTKSAAARGVKP